MDHLGVACFFAVTFGHCALMPWWVRRSSGPFQSTEELLFVSAVVTFGSLQAVLHVLACTVGISLPAGILALVTLHLTIAGLVRGEGSPNESHPRAARKRTPRPATPHWATLATQVPWLSVFGSAAVVTIVLTWLYRAADSTQILGIDARHYHVPYMVNYAHGARLFGFVATPHLYPVGASILGAWFYQAAGGPLLLDLVNLLPFLLLGASLLYLFRLLTGESGWEWATVVFLLLFTGKMFRVSLFISADLFYAASCTTLFTELCRIWVRGEADRGDWLVLALSTGMLLSSKPQGLMSAGLLVAIFAVALALRWVGARERAIRLHLSAGVAAWSLAVMFASGGVWLLRNWVVFGSPMAPVGLSLFGIPIFAGAPAANDWLSVAKDMREIPGYSLAQRFLVRSREWVGVWPPLFAAGLLGLLVDLASPLVTRGGVTERTARRLFAIGFFLVVFAAHVRILIQAPSSSIEIFSGQTLRYIIPFFALYALLMYACVFSDTLPWARQLRLHWVLVLPALTYLFVRYNTLTQMPVEWNRAYGVEDLVDYRWLPVALAAVTPWWLPGPPGVQRRWRIAAGALLVVLSLAYVHRVVTQGQRLAAQESQQLARERALFERTGRVRSIYRGAYYLAVSYQHRTGLRCPQSRFFTMSRFDFPVDLQDPGFHNLVFDVQGADTRIPRFLASDGPGHTACDFVVAVHAAATEGGTPYPAVTPEEITRALMVRGSLEAVGDSGRYRVYYVHTADGR
jgi:hypothetical protein